MLKYIRYGILTFAALTYLSGCRATNKDHFGHKQEPVFRTSALMDVDKNNQLDSLRIEEGSLEVLLKKGSKYERKIIGRADVFDVMDVDNDGDLDIVVKNGNKVDTYEQKDKGFFEKITR